MQNAGNLGTALSLTAILHITDAFVIWLLVGPLLVCLFRERGFLRLGEFQVRGIGAGGFVRGDAARCSRGGAILSGVDSCWPRRASGPRT